MLRLCSTRFQCPHLCTGCTGHAQIHRPRDILELGTALLRNKSSLAHEGALVVAHREELGCRF